MTHLDNSLKDERIYRQNHKELVIGTFYTGKQLSSIGYNVSSNYCSRSPREMQDEKRFPTIIGTNGVHHYVFRPIALECFSSWDEVWFGVEKRFDGHHVWLAPYNV